MLSVRKKRKKIVKIMFFYYFFYRMHTFFLFSTICLPADTSKLSLHTHQFLRKPAAPLRVSPAVLSRYPPALPSAVPGFFQLPHPFRGKTGQPGNLFRRKPFRQHIPGCLLRTDCNAFTAATLFTDCDACTAPTLFTDCNACTAPTLFTGSSRLLLLFLKYPSFTSGCAFAASTDSASSCVNPPHRYGCRRQSHPGIRRRSRQQSPASSSSRTRSGERPVISATSAAS